MSIFSLKQITAIGLAALVNLDKLVQKRCDRYVLSYHRVLTASQAERDGMHDALWITPEGFEAQIKWMQHIGKIVDYSRILDTSRPNGQPLFSLTFDDGWKDNYEFALPILKKYNVPALIFLATNAVDKGELFWPQDIATKTRHLLAKGSEKQIATALLECWSEPIPHHSIKKTKTMDLVECWIESLKLVSEDERVQRIDEYYRLLMLSSTPLAGYIMNWNDAREMQKYGINFGSHTHNHTILKGLHFDQIEQELMQSKSLIADKLQVEVDSFCYPNGRYNKKEGLILAHCGYRYGFSLDNMSLQQHYIDNFYVPRFLVNERKIMNSAYFKLCLLETPFYKSKPHDPHEE